MIRRIRESGSPVSGASLAACYQVSRQVIVQDIALLRAAGYEVISTNRGYVLAGTGEGLWRQERNGRQLALPYQADRPFPMVPLFCFAQIQTIGGQSYAVYRFDKEEHPIFP